MKFSLDPMLCNPQSGANRAAKESFNKSIKTLKETRCQYSSNLKTRASSAAFSTTTALFSLEPARVTNNDPPSPYTHIGMEMNAAHLHKGDIAICYANADVVTFFKI